MAGTILHNLVVLACYGNNFQIIINCKIWRNKTDRDLKRRDFRIQFLLLFEDHITLSQNKAVGVEHSILFQRLKQ